MFTTVYRLTVSTIHDFGGVTHQDLPSDPVSCWGKEECGSMSDIGYLVSTTMVEDSLLSPILESGICDIKEAVCNLSIPSVPDIGLPSAYVQTVRPTQVR